MFFFTQDVSARTWLSLATATITFLFAGANYGFSAWSESMREMREFDQPGVSAHLFCCLSSFLSPPCVCVCMCPLAFMYFRARTGIIIIIFFFTLFRSCLLALWVMLVSLRPLSLASLMTVMA